MHLSTCATSLVTTDFSNQYKVLGSSFFTQYVNSISKINTHHIAAVKVQMILK